MFRYKNTHGWPINWVESDNRVELKHKLNAYMLYLQQSIGYNNCLHFAFRYFPFFLFFSRNWPHQFFGFWLIYFLYLIFVCHLLKYHVTSFCNEVNFEGVMLFTLSCGFWLAHANAYLCNESKSVCYKFIFFFCS